MRDRRSLFVVCAILLGCLVAILPYLIYPSIIVEREMGILAKSMHPREVPLPEYYKEYWASRETYSLENNLVQALATILFAIALSAACWFYSKRAI